jgi:hypothetical protein
MSDKLIPDYRRKEQQQPRSGLWQATSLSVLLLGPAVAIALLVLSQEWYMLSLSAFGAFAIMRIWGKTTSAKADTVRAISVYTYVWVSLATLWALLAEISDIVGHP